MQKRLIVRRFTLKLVVIAVVAAAGPIAIAGLNAEPAAAATPRPPFPRYTTIATGLFDVQGISPDGRWVVGRDPSSEFAAPAVWHDGVVTRLPVLAPNDQSFHPTDVMSDGTVVGYSDKVIEYGVYGYGPLMYKNGAFSCVGGVDCEDFTPGGGVAHAANDAGQVAAVVFESIGQPSRAARLTISGSAETFEADGELLKTHIDASGGISTFKFVDLDGFRSATRPVIVRGGVVTDLCPILPGCPGVEVRGFAFGSSALGDVGTYYTTPTGACVSGCVGVVRNNRYRLLAKNAYPRVMNGRGDIVYADGTGLVIVNRKNQKVLFNSRVRPPAGNAAASLGFVVDASDNGFFVDSDGTLAVPDLVVNTTADIADSDPSDDRCAIIDAPTMCSLRAAIVTANASVIPRTIAFDIGQRAVAPTIKPLGALPAITKPGTVVDAATQPGTTTLSSHIQLDGSRAGNNATGLRLLGSDVTVSGFFVFGFSSYGIEVGGSGDHTVTRNAAGVTSTLVSKPNAKAGISVSSPDNIVGGETFEDGNLIAGNGPRTPVALDTTPDAGHGIQIVGPVATGNIVRHNAIGIDPVTVQVRANRGAGVLIYGAGSNAVRDNSIGGNGTGVAVVGVTGEREDEHEAIANLVLANVVGAAGDPLVAQANLVGVSVDGADDTMIGQAGGLGNIVSGNSQAGIVVVSTDGIHGKNVEIDSNVVGLNSSLDAAVPNAIGVVVTAPETRVVNNRISGNGGGLGIAGIGSHGTFVSHNVIGASGTESQALGNTDGGIDLSGAADILIATNTISANGSHGISAHSDETGLPTIQLTIDDNQIGLDQAGDAALGNAGDGIALEGVLTASITNNRVSANEGDGISIADTAEGAASDAVQVLQNTVGLDAAGSAARPNGDDGVYVEHSSNVTIGSASVGNVIAANVGNAVELANGTATVAVSANKLGTNAAGTGFAFDAAGEVLVGSGVTNAVIGGDEVADANIIGVSLNGFGVDVHADDTVVTANAIGIGPGVADIADGGDAVRVSAERVLVHENVIGNTDVGIHVVTGRQNRLTRNSIRDVGAGITLDPGTNGAVPRPALIDVALIDGEFSITGDFDGLANETYRVVIYATETVCTEAVANEYRWGENEFDHDLQVTTDSAGHGTISSTFADAFATEGSSITALVEDSVNPTGPANTSEFSSCQSL